jgi:hypothetical protein
VPPLSYPIYRVCIKLGNSAVNLIGTQNIVFFQENLVNQFDIACFLLYNSNMAKSNILYMRRWRREQLRTNPIKYKLQAMVRRARARAKKKGIPCTLEWEQLVPLVKERCPYFTEIKLDWKNKKKGITIESPALDRIVPEKGYVIGNVEIISSKANNVKSLGKSEDLYRVADRLYEHEREDKNIELGESLKDMRYRLHGY